jgi:hypothetical protein
MVAAAPWQREKGHYFLVILRLDIREKEREGPRRW